MFVKYKHREKKAIGGNNRANDEAEERRKRIGKIKSNNK